MLEIEERIVAPVTHSSGAEGLAETVHGGLRGLFSSTEIGRRVKDVLNGIQLAHPFHPAMTDVTLGAFTTAAVLDGMETVTGNGKEGATTAVIGMGLASATVTIASGLADWSDLYGQQRRVGLFHALTNITSTLLFGASFVMRLRGGGTVAKALSTTGFLTVLFGGYLGGDLAYRLGTQVNRNAWVKEPKEFVPAMREADLPPDKPTKVTVKGVNVVLVRQGDKIYAMNETCSHAHGPLSQGHLEDGSLVCPWHGSTYRLEDGRVVHGPSSFSQTHYEVQLRDGQIEVRAKVPRL